MELSSNGVLVRLHVYLQSPCLFIKTMSFLIETILTLHRKAKTGTLNYQNCSPGELWTSERQPLCIIFKALCSVQ